MKNVWVLERFVSEEEIQARMADLQAMLANADKPEDKETLGQLIDAYGKHTEGHWLGYVGRTNYRQWCWDAKDFIRRNKGTEFGKAPLRVVKAQIEDDSKTWLDYTNAVVNEGVLRYLYATL